MMCPAKSCHLLTIVAACMAGIQLASAASSMLDAPVITDTVVRRAIDKPAWGMRYAVGTDWKVQEGVKDVVIFPTVRWQPGQALPEGAMLFAVSNLNAQLSAKSLDAKFLRDYTLGTDESFDRYVPSFALLSSGSTVIGGWEGREYTFTGIVSGLKLQYREARVSVGKRLFIFRVAATPKSFTIMLDPFNDLLSTVQFDDPSQRSSASISPGRRPLPPSRFSARKSASSSSTKRVRTLLSGKSSSSRSSQRSSR